MLSTSSLERLRSSAIFFTVLPRAGFIAVFVFLTLLVRRSRYTSVLPHRAVAAEG